MNQTYIVLLKNLNKIKQEKRRNILIESEKDIRTSLELVKLKDDVEIQTDIDFCAIEINYEDKMFINNLLNRQSNIVMKKNNKIIIISFEKNKSLPVELFTYSGACNIVSAYMVDYNTNKIDLKIVFTGRQEWERLGRYNSLDMSSDKKTWESLNEEYDEMLHNGRNDNSIITRNKVVPNSEGKKTIVRNLDYYVQNILKNLIRAGITLLI